MSWVRRESLGRIWCDARNRLRLPDDVAVRQSLLQLCGGGFGDAGGAEVDSAELRLLFEGRQQFVGDLVVACQYEPREGLIAEQSLDLGIVQC